MNIQQIQAWIARMEPLGQADLPMEIAGLIMTPHQLLQHAQANDDIWQKIKDKELK